MDLNSQYIQLIIFIGQIILLYLISRSTINELFYFLRFFIKNDHLVFAIVSIIFLPGTAIHEISHFLAATILFLKVYEVKIIPEWQKHSIKLGRVIYQKTDFVRSILVGVAPIFGGLLFFWWLKFFKLFPVDNLYLNILMVYIIFSVSTNMFSSKQDLIDLIYLIPIVIICAGIIYIFDIKINFGLVFTNQLINFVKSVNFYLMVSLAINIILIILFKSFQRLTKH